MMLLLISSSSIWWFEQHSRDFATINGVKDTLGRSPWMLFMHLRQYSRWVHGGKK